MVRIGELVMGAAQASGLTLGEIRGVVALRDRGEAPCGHVRALITLLGRDPGSGPAIATQRSVEWCHIISTDQ